MREVILSGYVKEGLGIASGLNPDPNLELNNTISLQKPFFERAGIPRIHKYHNGTINIDISPKEFKILKPHFEVTCEWFPGVTETFWLVDVVIEFKNARYPAYIYYPCPSPVKSHDDTVVELLTERIEGLKYGDSLIVQAPSQHIQFIDI